MLLFPTSAIFLNRNKHNWQLFFVFNKFPLFSTLLLTTPALPLLRRPWVGVGKFSKPGVGVGDILPTTP